VAWAGFPGDAKESPSEPYSGGLFIWAIGAEMTLDDAIATLYAREINCGCETFWDGGIKVWIGDQPGQHAQGGTMARR
jgi:hypothetical protein